MNNSAPNSQVSQVMKNQKQVV